MALKSEVGMGRLAPTPIVMLALPNLVIGSTFTAPEDSDADDEVAVATPRYLLPVLVPLLGPAHEHGGVLAPLSVPYAAIVGQVVDLVVQAGT